MSESQNKTEIMAHPFGPGDKVKVYEAAEVEQERRSGDAPRGKEQGTATVEKDGKLNVSGLKPGTYVAALERAESTSHQDKNSPSSTAPNTRTAFGSHDYVTFTVKSAKTLKEVRDRVTA